jgi:hypothetical protein
MNGLAKCARAFAVYDSHNGQPALLAGGEIFLDEAGDLGGLKSMEVQLARDGNRHWWRFVGHGRIRNLVNLSKWRDTGGARCH